MRRELFIKIIYYLIFSLLLISAGYSAYWLRPFNSEGAVYVFHILGSFDFHRDYQFYRFSDYLWQFPLVASLNILGEQGVAAGINLYSAILSFHPVLSLLFCYYLLHKKKQEHLFNFVIFSFLVITFTTLQFSLGMVITALSFYWPLLILILFFDENSVSELYTCVCLLVLLSFSHQTSLFLIPSLLFALIINIKHYKRISEKHIILFVLIGLMVSTYVYNLYQVRNSNSAENFVTAMTSFNLFLFTFSTAVFCFLVVYSIVFFLSFFKKSGKRLPALSFVFGLLIFLWYLLGPHSARTNYALFAVAYNGRIFAALLSSIFACSFLALLATGDKQNNRTIKSLSSALTPLVFFAAACALHHDFSTTYYWSAQAKKVTDLVENNVGCVTIDDYVLSTKHRLSEGFAYGHFQSLIFQKTLKPKSIALIKNSTCNEDKENDFCKIQYDPVRGNNYFANSCGDRIDLYTSRKSHFDLTYITGHK